MGCGSLPVLCDCRFSCFDPPRFGRNAAECNPYGSVGCGVPWEIIVRLANTLGCNLWLNLPAGVADDYILGLATLLNTTLGPDITVVLEYGNEMWNGHFIGRQINMQLAVQEVDELGIEPDRVVLELTESTLMADSDALRRGFSLVAAPEAEGAPFRLLQDARLAIAWPQAGQIRLAVVPGFIVRKKLTACAASCAT